MGCQPAKMKVNTPRLPRSCISDEAPEIQCDQKQHAIMPKYQVIDLACGYLFEPQNYKDSTENSTKSQAEASDVQQILNEYDRCANYYKEHDLDKAIEHAKKLCQMLHELKKKKSISENNQTVKQLGLDRIHEMEGLVKNVQEQYNDVITFQNQIYKEGWIQKSNKKGVKVSIRPEGETVSCLIESQIETPFEILIAILIEMDLYKDFIPFVKISTQEKEVARNCRLGYSQNHIPFMSVREAFFQGIGYNRLDTNGSLFLLTRSIHNREDLQQKFGYKCKCNQQYIQLDYKYLVLKYQPIKRGKGKITIVMNVNPRLDFLPMWLLEKVSVEFGQDFLKNVLKMSGKFKNSKWEQNVKKNPHLFNFFKDVIDDFVTKLEGKQQK